MKSGYQIARLSSIVLMILCFVVVGLTHGCATAQQKQSNSDKRLQQSQSPLISAAELHKGLGSSDLVILDLGPEKEDYDKGHIAGARYVDWVDDITDLEQSERYNVADRDKIQALLRRVGATSDSRIVLYDDMDTRVSTRMYWTLKYYGVESLQILNGGRRAWKAAGKEFTSDATTVTVSNIKLEKANQKMSIDIDSIADRLQDPKVSLIDGRPVKQFSGEEAGKVFHTGALHEKKGHIPGAVNIFWKDNFNSDGTFKSKEELEKLYKDVTGSEEVVTYCNEGLHAAPPWFVMSELLGHGNVRVYDSSLSEWANSDRPMEKSGK